MKIIKISKNIREYPKYPKDIVLPGQDFFKPNPDFLKFLKQLVGSKTIVECGAGNGLLTKKMKEIHINVLPIDLFNRDSNFISLKQDATTFKYTKNSIVLIARPNRGEWIHNTMLQAIKTSSLIIYIGLPTHLSEDVFEFANLYPNIVQFTEIYKNAGEDGEVCFKISNKENKSISMGHESNTGTKYYLVKYQAARDLFFTSWFEDGGDKWLSYTGSYMPKSLEDTVLEEQSTNDIHDLDWKKTTIYKPNSNAGWLGRDGTFIGCDSQEHDLVADLILNKSVAELEKTGWVRIYDKDNWSLSPDQPHLRLSPEQRNYLSFHGHHITDND